MPYFLEDGTEIELPEKCRGCTAINEEDRSCIFLESDIECICGECLVKMICRSWCPDATKAIDKL